VVCSVLMPQEHLSPLELRLEISKCISNLEFDLLKRVYDGQAILEGYEKREVELHVHVRTVGHRNRVDKDDADIISGDRRFCGVWTFSGTETSCMAENGQVSVLIWVRNGCELFRPLNSIVRLQPLDICRMCGTDSAEKAFGLTPSPEALQRALDRELRALLWGAGIKRGKLVDEIVEGRSEIVDRLADENGKHERDRAINSVEAHWRGLRIEASNGPGTFVLSIDERHDGLVEVSKMFFCPVYPDISAIKRMHDALLLDLTDQKAGCYNADERSSARKPQTEL